MSADERALAVGERLKSVRVAAGFSLSELARRSGLGKGTLSELESGQRNPTLETLYALTAPLGIGLATLLAPDPDPALGSERPSVSGDGVTADLLDFLRPDPDGPDRDGPTTEVYRLTIAPNGRRVSPAHGDGVVEQLTVVNGTAVLGPEGEESVVEAGNTFRWVSDRNHVFAAQGGRPVVGILIITHPRRDHA